MKKIGKAIKVASHVIPLTLTENLCSINKSFIKVLESIFLSGDM